jgi:hypothetical protein
VVAQLQGFNNPLVDLPFYALASVRPWLAGAGVGALHGLGWGLVALLGLELTGRRLALLAAAAGIGPITLAVHGGASGDATVGVLCVGALLLLERRPGWAGLLLGVAVGLKPTAGPWVVGMGLSFLWAPRGREIGRWLGGVVGGSLASAGWWMVGLQQRYGSPLFPQFNELLRSTSAPETSYTERRFHPDGLWEALTFPLAMARGGEVAWEFAWRGAWFALLLVATPVGWRYADRRLRRILVVVGGTWVTWQLLFCMARYVQPLELLAPTLVLALLLVSPRKRAGGIFAALAVGAALWMRVPDVERRPWSDDLFGLQLPPVPLDDTLVILAGDDATSYVVTALPPTARAARISSNVAHFDEQTELNRAMAVLIRTWPGPFVLLEGPNPATPGALEAHGLARAGDCAPIRSDVDPGLRLCPLVRERIAPWPPRGS